MEILIKMWIKSPSKENMISKNEKETVREHLDTVRDR